MPEPRASGGASCAPPSPGQAAGQPRAGAARPALPPCPGAAAAALRPGAAPCGSLHRPPPASGGASLRGVGKGCGMDRCGAEKKVIEKCRFRPSLFKVCSLFRSDGGQLMPGRMFGWAFGRAFRHALRHAPIHVRDHAPLPASAGAHRPPNGLAGQAASARPMAAWLAWPPFLSAARSVAAAAALRYGAASCGFPYCRSLHRPPPASGGASLRGMGKGRGMGCCGAEKKVIEKCRFRPSLFKVCSFFESTGGGRTWSGFACVCAFRRAWRPVSGVASDCAGVRAAGGLVRLGTGGAPGRAGLWANALALVGAGGFAGIRAAGAGAGAAGQGGAG